MLGSRVGSHHGPKLPAVTAIDGDEAANPVRRSIW
jgi:hypothetical protein